MNGQSNDIRNAAIIGAIATVIGEIIYIIIAPILANAGAIPAIASQNSADAYNIMYIFTLASIPVFMFVIAFIGYAVYRYRVPGRPEVDGPPIRGNSRLQIAWILVSLALVTFLYVVGFEGLTQIEAAAPADALHVKVTGEQWLWNYNYSDYSNIGSSTLYLPVNRAVEFSISSVDVQHSFWIPELGVKQDAVPGESATYTVTPNRLGTFEVRCVELCGIYHAYMNTQVKVISQSDFAAWVAQQQQTAHISAPPISLAELPAMALVGVTGQRS